MKYQFMKEHANEFSLERMSKVFKVSRSCYDCFAKRALSKRAKKIGSFYQRLLQHNKNSRCTYGSPRIQSELKAQGEICSRKRAARLM